MISSTSHHPFLNNIALILRCSLTWTSIIVPSIWMMDTNSIDKDAEEAKKRVEKKVDENLSIRLYPIIVFSNHCNKSLFSQASQVNIYLETLTLLRKYNRSLNNRLVSK